MGAIFREHKVGASLAFNFDDVFVNVGGFGEKSTVLCTSEINSYSKSQHLSVSSLAPVNANAHVTAKISIIHNCDGSKVKICVKIQDNAFDTLEMFQLSDDLYVMYVLPTSSKEEIFLHFCEHCVLPAIAEVRESLVKASLKSASSLSLSSCLDDINLPASPSQASFPSSSSSPPPPVLPALVTFDGAFEQTSVVMQNHGNAFSKNNVQLVKFSAACSLTQQPADNGKMHQGIKAKIRSDE